MNLLKAKRNDYKYFALVLASPILTRMGFPPGWQAKVRPMFTLHFSSTENREPKTENRRILFKKT